eukprot:4305113-Prymnesium_polylepis.1
MVRYADIVRNAVRNRIVCCSPRRPQPNMPLTLEALEAIQGDAMADDIAIDFDRMTLWTEAQAVAYFESGGTQEPRAPLPRIMLHGSETMADVNPGKPLPPFRAQARPEFLANVAKRLPGMKYGLPMPATPAELQEMGASWLTQAFHAAGALPRSNAV